ncbi:MAG: SUMF1/EgtB/PvdO family nonheme iron enzyme [Anaerolineae bacterium]|nr:SUMF1/EgtB/PvdO family nonheme iron enzyme [Anaerolineae bacterium]
MENYEGKSIGRYQVLERQGAGGMAVVYHAYDTALERDVAIKMIRTENIPESMHEQLIKRFEREAKAQAKFNHTNIVPIYDYGVINGVPYLVMEYVPGATLKERIGIPIPHEESVRWLAPIADALAYAHERGVIHRDIKPGNILIRGESQPVLSDFGIAKMLEGDDMHLTSTGLGVGTPGYMAPEQWHGKVTQQTDIYALGVVLYEMVTGKKPYFAETPAAVAILQATEPLPRPTSIIPSIPDAIERVLLKALAKEPQHRYGSMREFHDVLRNLVESNETAAVHPPEAETLLGARSGLKADKEVEITGADRSVVVKTKHLSGYRKPLLWMMFCMILIGGFAFIGFVWPGWMKGLLAVELPLVELRKADGMSIVFVPEGKFTMGSEQGGQYERPAHMVNLSGFWIDQYEVTNGQYEECVRNGACDRPGGGTPNSNTRSAYYGAEEYANYPVIFVRWDQANDYCRWVGGRLPTEAEWEKAARGTDSRMYPWGNTVPGGIYLNYAGLVNDTTQVGTYPKGASPYGAMDMAGNVLEWTADWFGETYYRTGDTDNPNGPESGDLKVIRGGGFGFDANSVRTFFRHAIDPAFMYPDLGFRCVMERK